MRPQQHRRQHNGHRVGNDMLQRVRILRRKGHGRCELVVRLVDALVQRPPVEETVRVVKERFAGERADDKVAYQLGDRG